jgi:hypothetical protein
MQNSAAICRQVPTDSILDDYPWPCITCGMSNRSVGSRGSETQFHPIDMIIIIITVSSPTTNQWRCREEGMYSSYSFTTTALDGGEWSASRPGRALPLGKGPPVPIVQEAGWAPEPVWTQRLEEKSFRFCRGLNPDRPVVQSVVRHYTVWATRVVININSTTPHIFTRQEWDIMVPRHTRLTSPAVVKHYQHHAVSCEAISTVQRNQIRTGHIHNRVLHDSS